MPLALALLAAGCGDTDSERTRTTQRADPAETERAGDAAVSFYTSHDPRICRTHAARTLIETTVTAGGAAGVRRAIRSCERNRRAGRVLDRADVDVLRVRLDGRTGTVYVGVTAAGGERSCAALGVEKLSGPWRVASIDALACARVR